MFVLSSAVCVRFAFSYASLYLTHKILTTVFTTNATFTLTTYDPGIDYGQMCFFVATTANL